jgi:16S rRNA U516 pseudouridylate synthase RsuA-like enzyme
MNDTIKTLRMIAARSLEAQQEALGAIRAQQVHSPMAARRAERAAGIAFADQAVEWTPEERLALSELLGQDTDDTRTLDVRVRVTAGEKEQVKKMAAAAGFPNVSDFIRSRIGLS